VCGGVGGGGDVGLGGDAGEEWNGGGMKMGGRGGEEVGVGMGYRACAPQVHPCQTRLTTT